MKRIYLACPYTSSLPAIVAYREKCAAMATAQLIENTGAVVFSPITHGHRIADFLPKHLRLDSEFWMKQCIPFLRACDELYVLQLPKWEKSSGVKKEIQAAHSVHIPVRFINFEELIPMEMPNAD